MSDKLKLRVQWDNIMQKVSNITTSWSNTPSDTKYPSEKLVKNSLDTKENTNNKTTTINSSSTDSQYPSAKSVYTAIQDISPSGGEVEIDYYWDNSNKQLVLEWDNITQINGGGRNVEIVTEWEQTPSDEKVPSEKLTKDTFDTKISKSSTNGLMKNDGTVDTTSYSTFNGSYSNLTNKPSYTPTVTSSTTGAYKMGSINISGSNVDIYGKDTDTQPPVIADNLTTDNANQTLSAKQGKVLKEYIDTLVGNIEEDMLS